MFPTNPFDSKLLPAQVVGIQPKLGTPVVQVSHAPTVPASHTQFFAVTDKANIVFGLGYVLGLVANNQILTLNNTQIQAVNTVFTQWNVGNPYGASLPGNVTIPAAALVNTVIAMQAVNYVQTTGLLTTQQDLINSNGTIQMVTGFAPNGASSLTIHNQKVIACAPNTGLWSTSNVGAANSFDALFQGDLEVYSDQPVCPDQCYGYLVIFGQQSLQWFVDNGGSTATPFPYVELPGAAYNIGIGAEHSRAQFMGDLVFLGRYKTGQMHFFQTNGTGLPTIISTADIDQIINNFPSGQYQDAVASTDDFNGHPVYIVTFITAQRTFLFDGITKIWSELQSGTAEHARHLTTLRATLNNGTLASDYASGNVYFVDPNNYTDNGYIIKREFVSKHVKNNGNIFSVSMIELIMQVGTGAQKTGTLPAPFTSTPGIQVSVSTDGGNTWSQPEPAELGEVGEFTTRVYWRQLGTGRDFLFKFTCTDPVPFIVASGYASIIPGQPD